MILVIVVMLGATIIGGLVVAWVERGRPQIEDM